MPRKTETYRLQDVAQGLDQRLDNLADKVAKAGDDEDTSESVQEARQLEGHLAGIQWAIDEYGADAEITLGALTTGEYARVSDYTTDAANEQVGGPTSVEGASQIFFVAAGLVDAPFVDDSAGFEDRCAAVRGLPPQITRWLESQVDELTTPDVDLGNGFEARVAERRSDDEGE